MAVNPLQKANLSFAPLPSPNFNVPAPPIPSPSRGDSGALTRFMMGQEIREQQEARKQTTFDTKQTELSAQSLALKNLPIRLQSELKDLQNVANPTVANKKRIIQLRQGIEGFKQAGGSREFGNVAFKKFFEDKNRGTSTRNISPDPSKEQVGIFFGEQEIGRLAPKNTKQFEIQQQTAELQAKEVGKVVREVTIIAQTLQDPTVLRVLSQAVTSPAFVKFLETTSSSDASGNLPSQTVGALANLLTRVTSEAGLTKKQEEKVLRLANTFNRLAVTQTFNGNQFDAGARISISIANLIRDLGPQVGDSAIIIQDKLAGIVSEQGDRLAVSLIPFTGRNKDLSINPFRIDQAGLSQYDPENVRVLLENVTDPKVRRRLREQFGKVKRSFDLIQNFSVKARPLAPDVQNTLDEAFNELSGEPTGEQKPGFLADFLGALPNFKLGEQP